MRLINISSMELEYFMAADEDIPPYAILSHTWGREELSLQQFTSDNLKAFASHAGYIKIETCCRLAAAAGLEYVWVDTVCIDKTSSAELAEAINSMFQWYRNAAVCHAWLADLPSGGDMSALRDCRWFTRGWTLQELLAPARLEFYDEAWAFRGTKQGLWRELSDVTQIGAGVLEDPGRMFGLPVAQRMSWAAGRQTTRLEDLAYCLMGIFDVHMPLLYGEGRRAFQRLQEEIAKETNDLSLFAWRAADTEEGQKQQQKGHQPQRFHGFFATSPAQFRDSHTVRSLRSAALDAEFAITNKGVHIDKDVFEAEGGRLLFPLGCSLSPGSEDEVCLWVRSHGGNLFSRTEKGTFGSMTQEEKDTYSKLHRRMFLMKRVAPAHDTTLSTAHAGGVLLRHNFRAWRSEHWPEQPYADFPFEVTQVLPAADWVAEQRVVLTHNAPRWQVEVRVRRRQDAVPKLMFLGSASASVLVVKRRDEEEPFAALARTADLGGMMTGRMTGRGGELDEGLLARQGASATLPLFHGGGVRLTVVLGRTKVEGETVYCVDLSE